MKQILCLFLSFVVTSSSFAQKTIHDPNAEIRKITGSFHAIEVSGGIDLYLSAGDEAVVVSAREVADRNRIKTELKDGMLKISYDWKDGLGFSFHGGKNLKAYVSYKTLDKLTASGGSDVRVDGTLQSADLSVSLGGGSDFFGKLAINKLDIRQSGGSDTHISGTAQTLNLTASGGSDMNGYDLVAENCIITASGGSDVHITVSKMLEAVATGASDINWKGAATMVKTRASGAGSVSHRS